jgi:rod shape-determining protein MreC
MPQQGSKKIIVYSVLISAILFFGYRTVYVSSPGVLEKVSSILCYPVLVAQRFIAQPIARLFLTNKTEKELRTELNKLYKKQEALMAENIELRASFVYAQDIKEVHEFKKKYAHYNPSIAAILARHISDQEHYFLVNAGSQHTIKKDMVAMYNNCLLGRVTEVYPWYSKVQLITDKACGIAAYCSHTKTKGIHQGLNVQNKTELTFVTHLDEIRIGDLIISSGEGLVFPQGFGLGRVADYTKNGLHHTVIVKPLIDFNNLDYVLLIAKS